MLNLRVEVYKKVYIKLVHVNNCTFPSLKKSKGLGSEDYFSKVRRHNLIFQPENIDDLELWKQELSTEILSRKISESRNDDHEGEADIDALTCRHIVIPCENLVLDEMLDMERRLAGVISEVEDAAEEIADFRRQSTQMRYSFGTGSVGE